VGTSYNEVFLIDSSNAADQSSSLTGIAIGKSGILLGQAGLAEHVQRFGAVPKPDELTEGRFIYIHRDGARLSIHVDPMGQDAIFHYIDSDAPRDGAKPFWAVSNSLYWLVQHVASKRKLYFYTPAIASHQIGDGRGFGAQLVSNSTPITGIGLAPMDRHVVIDLANGRLALEKNSYNIYDDGTDSDYRQKIESFIASSASNILSIIDSQQYGRLICDVSGGHDSRFMFGLIHKLGLSSSVEYVTDAAKVDDLRIVNLLHRHYKFDLGYKINRSSTFNTNEVYDTWLAASAGVYLPIKLPFGGQSSLLRVSGGNFLTKKFGALPANERIRKFARFYKNKSTYNSVCNEFDMSFEQIGTHREDPFCMQKHYINFRARLHYGRNWHSISRGQSYTPLISSKLCRAAFSLPPEDYYASMPSLDVLAAIDNMLAVIPFDLDDKYFNSRMLERSPFWGDSIDFSKLDIRVKPVLGQQAEQPENTEANPKRGAVKEGFQLRLKEEFVRYLPEVKQAGLLESAYLEGAEKDAETLTGRPEKWRRVAHIVHLGRFMELGVQVS